MDEYESRNDPTTDHRPGRLLERKIGRAKSAMAFEQVWRGLWPVLAVAATFVLVSLTGIWDVLGRLAHIALLTAFGVAIAGTLLLLLAIRWPTREAAIRRLETVSKLPHRPASSYEDRLSAQTTDPATLAIWQAHRLRLSRLIKNLRAGKPQPRTDRYDPFALRALLLLLLAASIAFVGANIPDRLKAAFRFPATETLAEARLDAWIVPPAYTARPPMMLADGPVLTQKNNSDGPEGARKPLRVPAGSIAVVRVSGTNGAVASVQSATVSEPVKPLERQTSVSGGDVAEYRHKLVKTATLRVLLSDVEVAHWDIAVTPDNLPKIKLSQPPSRTPKGSMKLSYKVTDDYGVAGAVVQFMEVKRKVASHKRAGEAWMQPPDLEGPRPPKRRPPVMELRLPHAGSKDGQAHTYLEFGAHPWAGKKVIMTLEAKDVAGQTGRSPGIEVTLPERQFTKPLARAVIEQRRKLMDDPRYRRRVLMALGSITLDPEGFFDDARVYLGLRTVYHRLRRSRSRATIKSVVDQLWQIALRIEDGDLSDAERALRDAQDKLARALEEGASEEELKKLMQELRQALNNYMDQLAKANDDNLRDFSGGNDQNDQMIGQKDLEQMMQKIEDLARSGARDQAQQMLSEMRDLMERMQAGQMSQEQIARQQQMNRMMNELGNMVGDQKQLMDDTFQRQREGQGQQQGQRGQRQQEGQFGQPGQRGMPRLGPPQGDRQGPGQQRQGQMGQGQSQRGQDGQSMSPSELARRQQELRDALSELQRQMEGQGIGRSQQLEGARESMEKAEDALRAEDYPRATSEQARALDQMRQGAESLAEDMMSNMPQRYGQQGEQRDPLGRPQRSEGPELGTSVKVPDEIELQQAREIIDELRRRRGEVTRPPVELDYLDRLLRRF